MTKGNKSIKKKPHADTVALPNTTPVNFVVETGIRFGFVDTTGDWRHNLLAPVPSEDRNLTRDSQTIRGVGSSTVGVSIKVDPTD